MVISWTLLTNITESPWTLKERTTADQPLIGITIRNMSKISCQLIPPDPSKCFSNLPQRRHAMHPKNGKWQHISKALSMQKDHTMSEYNISQSLIESNQHNHEYYFPPNTCRTWLYLTEHIIISYLLFLVLEKKVFLLTSPFFKSTSTRYHFILYTIPICITSTKFSTPLREFLYHAFLYPNYRTRLI